MFHYFVFVTLLLLYFEKVRLLRDNHPPSLAKMKEVQICSDKTQYLTDDYLDEKSFIPNGCSDGDIEITVKLNNFRKIHYVILYSSRTVVSGDDPLDRFNVYILNNNPKQWWCGRFLRPINMTKNFSKGFRVNCNNYYQEFNKVVIVLKDQTQFQLAEIGVYSLALSRQAFHRGCFYSEEADSFGVNTSDASLANCRYTCSNINSIIMIGRNKCACGDVTWLEREVNMSECDNCLEVERCGGREAYSVYLFEFDLPYISGCLNSFVNQTEVPDVTIQECMRRCYGKIFSWVTANQCGCLDVQEKFRRHESECSTVCMENEDQICEKQSVIMTNCIEEQSRQFHCNQLFRCLNGNYDQYGVCIEGCENHWFGLHCIERDQELATNTTKDISITVILGGGRNNTPFNGTVTSFDGTPKHSTSLDGTPSTVISFAGTPTPDTSFDSTSEPDTSFDGYDVTVVTEMLVLEISTSNNIFNYFVFISWLAAWSLFQSPY